MPLKCLTVHVLTCCSSILTNVIQKQLTIKYININKICYWKVVMIAQLCSLLNVTNLKGLFSRNKHPYNFVELIYILYLLLAWIVQAFFWRGFKWESFLQKKNKKKTIQHVQNIFHPESMILLTTVLVTLFPN